MRVHEVCDVWFVIFSVILESEEELTLKKTEDVPAAAWRRSVSRGAIQRPWTAFTIRERRWRGRWGLPAQEGPQKQ